MKWEEKKWGALSAGILLIPIILFISVFLLRKFEPTEYSAWQAFETGTLKSIITAASYSTLIAAIISVVTGIISLIKKEKTAFAYIGIVIGLLLGLLLYGLSRPFV